jgi:hypothetical protein
MRFEVLMVVKMSTFFWVVMLCGLIGRCFGETYSGASALKMEYVSLKCWYLPTSPHGVKTQKNNTDNSGK